MATATICSTFDIVIQGADLNVAKTFIAGRAFTVVGIDVLNTAAGAGTLTVTAAGVTLTATTAAPPIAGAGIVQAQAAIGPTCPVSVLAANANVADGASVVVTASAVTITKVTLHCVGNPQESITIV